MLQPANQGISADLYHCKRIMEIINLLHVTQFRSIRSNQRMVRDHRRTWRNRPDIQAISPAYANPYQARRLIVEVDTSGDTSQAHRREIVRRVSRARVHDVVLVFEIIDPRNGQSRGWYVKFPGLDLEQTLRPGAFSPDLVLPPAGAARAQQLIRQAGLNQPRPSRPTVPWVVGRPRSQPLRQPARQSPPRSQPRRPAGRRPGRESEAGLAQEYTPAARPVNRIAALLRRFGFRNIQIARPAGGAAAQRAQPDIQAYAPDGRCVLVKVDTRPTRQRRHYHRITRLEPHTRSIFVLVHPNTGQTIHRIVYIPGVGPIIRQGAMRLDDLLPRPAAWRARQQAGRRLPA